MIAGALSRLAALLFGIGLALGLGETAVRLGVPAQEFWAVPDVYRAVAAPDVHYTYQPDLRGSAFGVDLRTNALGFRGPDWVMPKPSDVFRIALVGDSHAFGLGVPFAATAGEVLARLLRGPETPEVEVLNFGVNGYDSTQELGVLRSFVLDYEPDLLVLLPTSNDHESAAYADDAGFLSSVPPPGSRDAPSMRTAVLQVCGPWLRRSRLYVWVRRRFLGAPSAPAWAGPASTDAVPADPTWMVPIDDEAAPRDLEDSVGRPLRAMIAEARAGSIPVVVASLAAPLEYRRLLRRLTREESVPWIELLAELPEARSWPEVLQKFGLGWDPHLNAVAHERFGRALFATLRDHDYARGYSSASTDPIRSTKLSK